jgi:hypothetical protein
LSGDWGVAQVGSLYSYSGRLSDFDVASGSGILTLPSANASRSAFLLRTLARDVDLSFTAWINKPITGSGIWIYGTVRRATNGSAYRPKMRIASDGSVYVVASRLVGSSESPLGSAVRIPGLVATPSTAIHLRTSVYGANPTTVQVRAWADGDAEPSSWQFSATDSTPALQTAGSIGVLAYASSDVTNGPYEVHFGDLRALTTDPPRLAGPELVGAGDIASCGGRGDEQTARLLGLVDGSASLFTLGDNTYPSGTADEFANCFGPSWGQFKARLHPTVGNHEYNTPGAAPYFDYFGAAAGDPGKGYYAYNVGSWRIYVLNTNCGIISCVPGSTQETWFRNDLAANATACSLVMYHHPRYSSGSEHGSSQFVQPLWQDMVNAGVEIALSGHDHDYERFAPMNASGQADPANGVRSFVVGTGGSVQRSLDSTVLPNSEVHTASAFGVLRLVLGEGAYEWEFIPVAGKTFTDRGSGTCH